MEQRPLLDSAWVKHAFLVPLAMRGGDFDRPSNADRLKQPTSADYKYTDSSLGGNFAINNPPQFTSTADIRYPGLLNRRKGDGMGRYYSEAIDDPKQVVHMSFGVPAYNSLAQYFTSFYDSRMAKLANTGRSSVVFYNIGAVAGYVVSLPIQPFILGLTAVTRVYNFVQKQQPSKWYYFKPNMHSYWSAVNTIANDIAIHMGIIPRVFTSDQDDADLNLENRNESIDPMELHRILPELFRPDGGIDVMMLSTRSQRMHDRSIMIQEEIRKAAANPTSLKELLERQVLSPQPFISAEDDDGISSREYFAMAVQAEGEEDVGASTETLGRFWDAITGDAGAGHLTALKRSGNRFATFRVNHKGSVQESFSNAVKDSDVARQVNSKVQDARNLRFSMMDGNILGGIGNVASWFSDVASGALDSVQLGGLATLAGNAFLDVPKHWENSVANLPRADYTVPLYSPYGNKISRYINMMIPISMILAAGLPLSAGRSSYTSPFICQIYHQGRVQCQLGMIDSITIRRGTGNVGWNAEHEMLGAEIDFSVVDLSSIMHVPIKGAMSRGGNIVTAVATAGATVAGEQIDQELGTNGTTAAIGNAMFNSAVWDEGSAFNDYMAVLGSLPVEDSYYFQNRLNLNMTRSLRAFKTWASPENFMSAASNGFIGRTVMQFTQQTGRFD